MAMAAQVKIKKNPLGYSVPSQSGKGSYTVNIDGKPFCTCADFEITAEPCKHIYCVWYTIQREEESGAILLHPALEPEPQVVRPAPDRDWSLYNQAQVYELELFEILLRALCDTVEQPSQATGRPRLPLCDLLFILGLRIYGTLSVRRSMTNVRVAYANGLIERVPSFTTIFRCLEEPSITPVLERLIGKSALPLAEVEHDFAPDSTGFSTKVYRRWFEEKYGHEQKEPYWVKAHCMFGVKTG